MENEELRHTKVLSLADLGLIKKSSGLYFVLTVIEGRDFGTMFTLENNETILGRKEDDGTKPDIELDDDRISRRHVSFLKERLSEDSFYICITDLDSTNGTFVNGQRLSNNKVRLQDNDKIQFGSTILKFEIKDTLDTINYQERLYQQVTKDHLTNLWNYNYVKKELERIVSISSRQSLPFSLILMEIDYFQTFNETFGRNVGDAVLRATAHRIQSELREFDLAARYEGNKFLLILPETDMKSAANTAELLRQAIESFDFSTLGCPQRVTFSGGIAQFPACGRKVPQLLEQVDEALFRAKQNGRNRIERAEVTIQAKTQIWRKLIPVALGLLLVTAIALNYKKIVAAFSKPPSLTSTYSGTVESHKVLIGSKIGGRVTAVLVKEGQLVKAGEPLARFDVAELLAQRNLLIANIEQKKASLLKLKNGARHEEIAAADANVRKEKAMLEALRNGPRRQEISKVSSEISAAQSDLLNAQANFNRVNEVFNKGYFSQQARDDAENRLKLAKARVDVLEQEMLMMKEGSRSEEILAQQERMKEAEENAQMLKNGTRKEDLLQSQAELQAAQAELDVLNVRISESEVKSPSDSYVQSIRVRPGDIIEAGRPIAELLEKDQVWVRVYVPQTEMAKVHLRQQAMISVDSVADRQFTGLVEQISDEAEFYPRNVQTRTDREHQVFGVKVYIDDKDGVLKSGMSADVTLTP